MAVITFPPGHGTILVEIPENKLTPHVPDPGKVYMDAAYEIMKAICGVLSDRGEMPNVEDVAHHLKDLVAALGLEPRRPRL